MRGPLWHHTALASKVEAGRHWLPGTTMGRRETIVTSPRSARLLVAVLLSWQASHGAVTAVMAAYLLARLWSGRLQPCSRTTLDNIELFWRSSALQSARIMWGVQRLPRAMALACAGPKDFAGRSDSLELHLRCLAHRRPPLCCARIRGRNSRPCRTFFWEPPR